MKRTVILALAVILVLGSVVGFASATTNGSAQKKSEYVIQTLIPGETNTVKAGSKFIVALKENGTTGYSWTYKISNKKGIALYSEQGLDPVKDTGLVGVGIDKVWEFDALKAGKYTITYQYKRPFETKAIETLTYAVVIQK
jgi:predicted secreted protein